MRLTINDDPEITRKAVITLDGVIQKYCIVADEERGYVAVRRLDSKGRSIHNGYKLARCRRLFGKVKIEIDLCVNDMRRLWIGRPKAENIGEAFYEVALPNGYWDAIPMPGHI